MFFLCLTTSAIGPQKCNQPESFWLQHACFLLLHVFVPCFPLSRRIQSYLLQCTLAGGFWSDLPGVCACMYLIRIRKWTPFVLMNVCDPLPLSTLYLFLPQAQDHSLALLSASANYDVLIIELTQEGSKGETKPRHHTKECNNVSENGTHSFAYFLLYLATLELN